MHIELARLHEMHPRLPIEISILLALSAALGLERNGHRSGASIALRVDALSFEGSLAWTSADANLEQHDLNRVTEDGAEAVSLALAHRHHGWRVVRRLQRGEHADWLLEQVDESGRRLVALEVSGVDKGSVENRVRQKLSQVAECLDVDQRWAGVVGFEAPTAVLRSVGG
jgi:hypothetical protein